MSEDTVSNAPLPPVKLAFIIDNEVVDVLHTDSRLASIFLSAPTVVDVTGEDGEQSVFIGWQYDPETKNFTGDAPLQADPNNGQD
jgi:hypothetical protein